MDLQVNDMKHTTQERVKEVLHYDPDTGIFTWIKTRGRILKGSIAGTICPAGYLNIKLDRNLYRAHRLAFIYMTGSMPKLVDHINRIKDDNRWCNLRPATWSQNNINKPLYSTNTSGCKGVSWCKRNRRWVATCVSNGVVHYLGDFVEFSDAKDASIKFREKIHGEFFNKDV